MYLWIVEALAAPEDKLNLDNLFDDVTNIWNGSFNGNYPGKIETTKTVLKNYGCTWEWVERKLREL